MQAGAHAFFWDSDSDTRTGKERFEQKRDKEIISEDENGATRMKNILQLLKEKLKLR